MNWNERIARAERRGKFTDADIRLAWDSASCAVGEHKAVYRGEDDAWPFDPSLGSLSGSFALAVHLDNPTEARRIHMAIQKRVATLPKKYRRTA